MGELVDIGALVEDVTDGLRIVDRLKRASPTVRVRVDALLDGTWAFGDEDGDLLLVDPATADEEQVAALIARVVELEAERRHDAERYAKLLAYTEARYEQATEFLSKLSTVVRDRGAELMAPPPGGEG